MDDAEKAVVLTRLSILRTTAEAIDECLRTDALNRTDALDISIRTGLYQSRGELLARAERMHAEVSR